MGGYNSKSRGQVNGLFFRFRAFTEAAIASEPDERGHFRRYFAWHWNCFDVSGATSRGDRWQWKKRLGTIRIKKDVLDMIIHSNSQTSGPGNQLNPTGGFLPKIPAPLSSKQNETGSSEESPDVIATSRLGSVQSRVSEISNEAEAEEALLFARNHILSNPLGAIGVQANSSPSAVLKLLGEFIYS